MADREFSPFLFPFLLVKCRHERTVTDFFQYDLGDYLVVHLST